MKKRLSKAIQRQQEIVDKAKEEKRDLSEAEQKEFDDLQREIDICTEALAEIERRENEVGQPEEQNSQRILEDERSRIKEIRELGRQFDLEVDGYIDGGNSIDKVRAAVLEKLKEENGAVGTRGTGEVSVNADENDKFRAAAADALIMRGGIELEKSADGARELMSLSLRDLAITTMAKEGRTNLNVRSSDELFNDMARDFYNPTSAFPSILDTAINKSYQEGHKKTAVTFDQFVKKGSLSDFKIHDNYYVAGTAGAFLRVGENGELKHDIPSDTRKPTRKLETWGRQFTMTRQAFINDDIGFLTTVPSRYAASARKTQNKQVYEIMVNNAAIYDGTALFSKVHKNVLASGTGITQAAVQKMFLALQAQKDEEGEAIIIRPAIIVVPIGLAFDMFTLFNSPTINTVGNTQSANPLYNYRTSVMIVEDPTINALAGDDPAPWFVIGDKGDTDFIEVDYLNGQETPTIRRMEKPGTLGFVWDVYLDWGISVMDFRGAIKNPGVAIQSPLE